MHSLTAYKPVRFIVAYVALLTFLSLNPWFLPDPHQAIGRVTWDFMEHTVAYGFLSFIVLTVMNGKVNATSSTLSAVLLPSIIGLMLELGQYWFTTTRAFSVSDICANFIGTWIGVAAFWCIACARHINSKL